MDPTIFIPLDWVDAVNEGAPYVLAILVATTALVHAVLPIARAIERWARATPATWDDGAARRAVALLERAASVTAVLIAFLPRLTIGDADTRDAGGSKPPPGPSDHDDSGAGLALLVIATTCSVVMNGCGASAYSTHARGATITAASLSTVGSVVDAARDAALDRVEAEHPSRGAERDAALDAEAARWEPAGAALDAARAAVLTWIDAIDLARVAGGDGDLLAELMRIAARVVLLYERVVTVVRALGVDDVPALPDVVRVLAQGWAEASSTATAGDGGAE